jgi:hypothetical protein
LVYGVERALANEKQFSGKIEQFRYALGAEREKFADLLESHWEESADDPDARRRAADIIHEWLADTDDAHLFVDKLDVAANLDGLDLSGELRTFVDDIILGVPDVSISDHEYELLEELLLQHPNVFRDRAELLLFEGDAVDRLPILHALGETNGPWASEFLMERLEDLLQTEGVADVWDALLELSDPRTLDVAVDEWRPGEWIVAACAGRVAKLTGAFEHLDEDLRQDYRQQQRRKREFYDQAHDIVEQEQSLGDTIDDGPIVLPLKCTECGQIYSYELDRVFFDLERVTDEQDELRDAYVPGRIITCKGCEAVDACSVTS